MISSNDYSEAGKVAYQAFLDMTESKNKHFNHLANLEEKYKSGGVPSIQENLELEKLLSIHDSNVAAFKAALSAVTDEQEKMRLLQAMS